QLVGFLPRLFNRARGRLAGAKGRELELELTDRVLPLPPLARMSLFERVVVRLELGDRRLELRPPVVMLVDEGPQARLRAGQRRLERFARSALGGALLAERLDFGLHRGDLVARRVELGGDV